MIIVITMCIIIIEKRQVSGGGGSPCITLAAAVALHSMLTICLPSEDESKKPVTMNPALLKTHWILMSFVASLCKMCKRERMQTQRINTRDAWTPRTANS